MDHARRSNVEQVTRAAFRGDFGRVQRLFEVHGAYVIRKEDRLRKTALSQARVAGHLPIVEWLLQNGAKVNRGGPISQASSKGHFAIVQHLLENGADVNQLNRRDFYTLLHEATHLGHLPVVKLLVENGADLFAKQHWSMTPADLANYPANVAREEDWQEEEMQRFIAVSDYLESMTKVQQCHALVIHLLPMDFYARIFYSLELRKNCYYLL